MKKDTTQTDRAFSNQGKTKDTHSVLYRLRDEGLDVDRVSLAQIIAGNLEVVNTNT